MMHQTKLRSMIHWRMVDPHSVLPVTSWCDPYRLRVTERSHCEKSHGARAVTLSGSQGNPPTLRLQIQSNADPAPSPLHSVIAKKRSPSPLSPAHSSTVVKRFAFWQSVSNISNAQTAAHSHWPSCTSLAMKMRLVAHTVISDIRCLFARQCTLCF